MKEKLLKKIKQECIRLSEEEGMVFGEGNIHCKLMLVGEAPGAKEIELGRPFVGQAGKNLDEFIEILNIQREDLYITNTVKIRPYKVNIKTNRKSNRPPSAKEIEKYRPILLKEIEIIKPKIIVSLGNHSLRAVSGNKKISIGDVHGKSLFLENDSILYPLYHPAAIIYNRSLKEVYLKDLNNLKEIMVQYL